MCYFSINLPLKQQRSPNILLNLYVVNTENTDSIVSSAVKWLKYCRYVVNTVQSINLQCLCFNPYIHKNNYMYLVTVGYNERSQLHVGVSVYDLSAVLQFSGHHNVGMEDRRPRDPSMQQPFICCLHFCAHPDERSTKDINLLKSIRRKPQIYLNWSLSA